MQTNQQEQTLLLIDGLNIVRRVYGANPAPDSPDKVKGALRASLFSFQRALTHHKPDFALAAFDFGGNTWRHDLYPEYKKNRKPMPEVLREGLPQFREELADMGLMSVSQPEVEAEDTLASVFLNWKKLNRGPCTVLSTDKDVAALVELGARVWNHFTLEWHDEAWIQSNFGVSPAQFQDLLALTGDSSDDIPGVLDVGTKTAAAWLKLHGTLEGVIAAASTIKGKRGDNLRAGIELARLSRKLVALKTDLPLGLNLSSLRYHGAVPA